MYNFMNCTQMMFGSKVKYCITYKTNQKSFDIFRRKYEHSFNSNIYEENQVFANSSAVKEEVESSVRKLSLFDTLEDKNLESEPIENSTSVKSEPVFQNEILEEGNETTNPEENENEFSDDAVSESEDDFNQENEEELLDIPTFLRRQAN